MIEPIEWARLPTGPEISQRMSDRTSDMMCMADVHRWTVIKTSRTQSVAEHSFNVGVLAWELAWRLGLTESEDLLAVLMWSMAHDLPEVLTGDIDGKFKRDNPELRVAIVEAEFKAFPWYAAMATGIPDYINAVVKTADKIEAIRFINTWGIGPRADDVFRELMAILNAETIPKLVAAMGRGYDEVEHVVRIVLTQSSTENGCVQMRRHRKPKEGVSGS